LRTRASAQDDGKEYTNKNTHRTKFLNKNSALHLASENGMVSTVVKLLSLGADAALLNKYGSTSLWQACGAKQEAAAEELMEATKRAGVLDLKDTHYLFCCSALHLASKQGMVSTVRKLLALGADGSLQDKDGQTPVNIAANDEVKTVFAEFGHIFSAGVRE